MELPLRALRVLWPWLVCALAVLGYGCEQRRAGALTTQMATLRGERDALLKRGAIVRREFVHDTVILTTRVTEYRTLVDSIRSTDTLTVRERVIVAAADTAITACRQTVRSCAASLAIADSIHAGDARTIRALERARPGVLRRWGERLLWAGAGYAAGSLLSPR